MGTGEFMLGGGGKRGEPCGGLASHPEKSRYTPSRLMLQEPRYVHKGSALQELIYTYPGFKANRALLLLL